MKRFILRKSQLKEFIEIKKAERIFYDIVEQIHNNEKFLNENISHKKANQSVIDNFKRKNLINPKVLNLLIKHKIINENSEII
jgi:hypothetical protein